MAHVRKSRVLERLRAGEVVQVASSLPEAWNVELLGLLEFDCAWIDSEHNEVQDASVSNLAVAGRAANIDTLVRVRKESDADYFRFLEVGCTGILVPHCTTAEFAREVVSAAKFPPIGKRSLGGLGADARYGLVPLAEYLQQANDETFVAVQIESLDELEHAEAIAAVDGVDILFVGPGDLSLDIGAPGDFDHPRMQDALRRVSDAAANAGKWWGLPVGTPERVRQVIDLGARFVVYGSAKGILISGYKSARQTWKGLVNP